MLGSVFQPLMHSLRTLSSVAFDLICLVVLVSRSRRHWQPENLFLRKQLALFQERNVKPHPAHDSTRLVMVILGTHVLVAGRPGQPQAGYLPPLAAQGIPSPLALEILSRWQT